MTSDSWLKLSINFVCLPREIGKARALDQLLRLNQNRLSPAKLYPSATHCCAFPPFLYILFDVLCLGVLTFFEKIKQELLAEEKKVLWTFVRRRLCDNGHPLACCRAPPLSTLRRRALQSRLSSRPLAVVSCDNGIFLQHACCFAWLLCPCLV